MVIARAFDQICADSTNNSSIYTTFSGLSMRCYAIYDALLDFLCLKCKLTDFSPPDMNKM